MILTPDMKEIREQQPCNHECVGYIGQCEYRCYGQTCIKYADNDPRSLITRKFPRDLVDKQDVEYIKQDREEAYIRGCLGPSMKKIIRNRVERGNIKVDPRCIGDDGLPDPSKFEICGLYAIKRFRKGKVATEWRSMLIPQEKKIDQNHSIK